MSVGLQDCHKTGSQGNKRIVGEIKNGQEIFWKIKILSFKEV